MCLLHRFRLPLALRLPSSEELHAGTTTSSDVCLEPELEPDSNSRCQVQVKDRKANRARAIGVGARLWFGCLQPPSLDGSLFALALTGVLHYLSLTKFLIGTAMGLCLVVS